MGSAERTASVGGRREGGQPRSEATQLVVLLC